MEDYKDDTIIQQLSAPPLRFRRRLAAQGGVEQPPGGAEHLAEAVGEDRDRAFGVLVDLHPVQPTAIANRIPVAQEEHGKPLVEVTALADLLAIVEDRHRHAVDRPRHGGIVQPLDHHVPRRGPGEAEGLRIGPPAQRVGGVAAHADGPACRVDAAGIGEGLDEFELPVGRPAVVAEAEGDGVDGGGVALVFGGGGAVGVVLGRDGGG